MPAEAAAKPPAPVRRVVVNVHAAQRELVEDLGAVGARYRAERLRSLALIGLAVLRGGVGCERGAAPLPAAQPLSPTPDPQWERRMRLANSAAPDE
jgi:hypothetical protein